MKNLTVPVLVFLCAISAMVPTVHAQLAVPEGGTGLTGVPAGSLLYGNGSDPLISLGAGAEGSVLSLVGGLPAWVAPSSLTSPYLHVTAGGDVYLGSGISVQDGLYQNTIVGKEAYTIGGGYGQTGFGHWALRQLAAGQWNDAFGTQAGGDLGQGVGNAFMGGSAGTTGNSHTVWTGNFNTMIGFAAASNINPNGSVLNNNTIIGSYAADGQILGSGDNNILIGSHINLPKDSGSYQVNVGNILYGTNISGTGYTVSPGNIGIGSTTPLGRLSVQADGASTAPVLVLASASTVYTVDTYGHHLYNGPAPLISSCGSGATVAGTDERGRIHVGTGNVTTCTITFAHGWDSIPVCQLTIEAGTNGTLSMSPSVTSVTISGSKNMNGSSLAYSCDGI